MFASDLISTHILPLRTSDSLQTAYERMNDFKVSHLPIVNESDLLGILSDSVLVEQGDFSLPIGNLSLGMKFSYVYSYQHAFEVFRIISSDRLSLVPVVNSQKAFLGCITLEKMVEYGGIISSAIQPGGIIVIESSDNNYSVSEIAHILESNQTKILSCSVTSNQDSRKVIITLKLDKSDISSDLSALSRYNYQVQYSLQESGFHDEAQERFESFMNYLNM